MNKGHWETVETTDKYYARQKANWFRIGFEPLYADFTRSRARFEVGGVGVGGARLLGLVLRGESANSIPGTLVFSTP